MVLNLLDSGPVNEREVNTSPRRYVLAPCSGEKAVESVHELHDRRRFHVIGRLVEALKPLLSFPEKLLFTLRFGDPARQHKQRIAQAVEKFYDSRVHGFLPGQTHAHPLRPAAHRPSLMQEAGKLPASWQDELLER